MKHHFLSRTLSLAAAAALSCTAVLAPGGLQIAAQADEMPVQTELTGSTPVSVIIKVAGKAVMEQPAARELGTDFLDTEEAAQLTAQCAAVQQAVEGRIRALYPELEVGYHYSTLYNGFSCSLPENLIAKVETLPDVVGVSKAGDIEIPQMNRAAALSGFPAYYEKTGCTGAGQVIAVVDSELDPSHPMFAPLDDSVETKLSQDEVKDIIESGILNIEVDPERAYLSNKLPYVIDYVDDPYEGVPDPGSYHGTHVCGIAAGNPFEAEDGTVVSGIATDAQLLFMACGKGDRVYLDAAMAGFEDAVKLHADVINMSWGSVWEYYGDNPMTDLIKAADNAGVIVCNAAGNDDNGTNSKGSTITPANPDSCTIIDKAELGSPLLVVASANNVGQAETGMFLFEGEQIVYKPQLDPYNGQMTILSDQLEPGEYEYVDWAPFEAELNDFEQGPELGDEEDLNNYLREAVGGKLVLAEVSSYYAAMANNDAGNFARFFAESGALGIIVIDNVVSIGRDYIYNVSSELPAALVTYEEGHRMLEAENKTVTFTGENVIRDYPTEVSSYTSWGVKHSLDLRPDIMGIGGRVRSADYGNGTRTLSGTSMASPYLVGCVAVLRQYLEQNGIMPGNAEYTAYIRNLLMNTAIPYEEDGLFVTPRRQGAGMVSLERAAAAKVLMTGPAGNAKVNLFDNLNGAFAFPLTLNNYSDEDVTFETADIRLTTDGVIYNPDQECDIVFGQQELSCFSNLEGPITVGAGETVLLDIEGYLDDGQVSQLYESFVNGFFVEGYLLLSGAENSADISIPMLGFDGDWTALPIMKDTLGTEDACNALPGANKVARLEIINALRRRVPADTSPDAYINLKHFATEEELQLLEGSDADFWISPNHDGINDVLCGVNLKSIRNTRYEMQLIDADGNTIWTRPASDYNYQGGTYQTVWALNEDFQNQLPEGDFTFVVQGYLDYGDSKEHPQEIRHPLHVDRTAPEATAEFMEESGRKIVRITASDDRQLQGLAVAGIGSGGVVGVYDPEHTYPDAVNGNWFYPNFYYYTEAFLRGPTRTEIIDGETYYVDTIAYPPYAASNMGDGGKSDIDASFTFWDGARFQEENDGTFTLSYDVTDLEYYQMVVLDAACNYVEIQHTDDSAEQFVQKKGYWESPECGYYFFSGDTLSFYDFYEGTTTAYSYTAEQDQLTLVSGSNTRSYTVKLLSDHAFRLTDNHTGTVRLLYTMDELTEERVKTPLYPVNDFLKLARADAEEAFGLVPIRFEVISTNEYRLISVMEDDSPLEWIDYTMDLRTGVGSRLYNRANKLDNPSDGSYTTDYKIIHFYASETSEIPAGLYQLPGEDCCMQFYDDGKSGQFLYCADVIDIFGIMDEPLFKDGTPFSYTLDENGIFELKFNGNTLKGTLFKQESLDGYTDLKLDIDSAASSDIQYRLNRSRTDFIIREYSTDPEVVATVCSEQEELRRLSLAYVQAAFPADFRPDYQYRVHMNADQMFTICYQYDDGYSTVIVDPLTLQGYDECGNAVDLHNPPQAKETAYDLQTVEDWALNDLAEHTGIEKDSIWVISRVLENGDYSITFKDPNGKLIDTYTVDADTAVGSNQSGETVNLPQTGNNAPGMFLTTVLAFLLLTAGFACCGAALRRKEKAES